MILLTDNINNNNLVLIYRVHYTLELFIHTYIDLDCAGIILKGWKNYC